MSASQNSVLVRQQRARQQHNTSPVATSHDISMHNKSHTTPQSPTAQNSKLKDNTRQDSVSWWSVFIGYSLGAMYSSYNGAISYVMGNNNNDVVDNVSEDNCDPNNVLLTTDPLLLARKCLNRCKDEAPVKPSRLFGEISLQTGIQKISHIVNQVVDSMQQYTGSPVPISLFEDALIAADYDGTALLPSGTVKWMPQEYSSNTVSNVHSVKKENDDSSDWQLVHKSNDTILYTRPYKDTDLSQYRGMLYNN